MRRSGFTLIEMLVVVAIIGLLSSTMLVGLGDARRRARDARRIADLRQIQNGLENYYSTNRTYPKSEELYDVISGLPADPQGGKYGYVRPNQSTYVLGACLEGPRAPEIQSYSKPDAADFDVSPQGSPMDTPPTCTCESPNAYCVGIGS
jgi:prepilin-type N-terminal cleavage/methylation domain-containing protein